MTNWWVMFLGVGEEKFLLSSVMGLGHGSWRKKLVSSDLLVMVVHRSPSSWFLLVL